MAAETMRRWVLPACARAFLMKCTRQRCQVALKTLATAGLDPLVAVADDELDPAQTSAVQAPQELGPERLGLRVPDLDAEHLALPVGVDGDRHYHRHADDAAASRVLT
jgi:hypothetical protein